MENEKSNQRMGIIIYQMHAECRFMLQNVIFFKSKTFEETAIKRN